VITRVCERCGREFKTYTAWLRGGLAGRYCSRHCASQKPQTRYWVSATCVVCGKTYSVKRYRKDETKCCSRKCLAIYRGKLCQKPESWGRDSWEGACLRKAALIRANYRCERCGAEGTLHVHHIKPWCESNLDEKFSLDNVIVLCVECHVAEHPQYTGLIRGLSKEVQTYG
jgi:5-methylcytosine-specific restriction endonuclease McrA